MDIVPDDVLEASAVVANTTMNRERGLTGTNGYDRDLGFDPGGLLGELLAARADSEAAVTWLDLCCGRGRALVDAAKRLAEASSMGRLEVVGLDLVDHFDPAVRDTPGISVAVGSIGSWDPARTFDLITCVHGLHYLGDKLGDLARIAGWLSRSGRFVANFDLAGLRWADGSSAGRSAGAALRAQGFDVDTRRHRIALSGGRRVALPFEYLGADPDDGPNYTGQPAVASYYRKGDS